MRPDDPKEIMGAIDEILTLHNIRMEAYEKAMAEGGDFSGVLAKTQERLNEMQKEADEMLAKAGMTRDDFKNYVANQANFSSNEWKMLETTKKTCEEIRQQSQQIIESRIPKELREAPLVKKKKKRPMAKKKWLQM